MAELPSIPSRPRTGILWIVAKAWEDERLLLPQRELIPCDIWVRAAYTYGWRVVTLADGFLDDGPYAGGVVVALETANGRHYCALPPAALPALRGLVSPNDYAVIVEGIDGLY